MKSTKYSGMFFAAGVLLAASPAFALTTVSATVTARAGSTTVSAAAQTRIADAISRADQEIARRITALTSLNTDVQAMVHVSADGKTAISTETQNEISSLTSLKATIDAETALAAVRADIQSITKDYRIFMLIVPQGRIEVAADKIQTVTALYTTFAGKLQARISAAPAGTDTAQVNAWLSDMNAKIADANMQAQAAVMLVAALQPDQGVQATMTANTAALKSARVDIKTALADLKTARQDAGSIVKAIQSWDVHASASATTSTQ